ncbi:MAG: hypothetical protein HY203_10820 [Nitrospirae bacterium]|nr:hypothetical protein [Nitrospirota bacterium]
MNRLKNVISIAIVVLMFSMVGCAASMVLMKNDKGEIARCEPNTGSTIAFGYIGSKMSVNSCVAEYEKLGYKRVQ